MADTRLRYCYKRGGSARWPSTACQLVRPGKADKLARLGTGRRGRDGRLSASRWAAPCEQLAVCVPPRHAAGFRALNAGLKKRAFRLDSDHLVWADVEAGV